MCLHSERFPLQSWLAVITAHVYLCWCLRSLKFCSLHEFRRCYTVLPSTAAIFHVRSSGLIHLLSESLCLLPASSYPSPQPLATMFHVFLFLKLLCPRLNQWHPIKKKNSVKDVKTNIYIYICSPDFILLLFPVFSQLELFMFLIFKHLY